MQCSIKYQKKNWPVEKKYTVESICYPEPINPMSPSEPMVPGPVLNVLNVPEPMSPIPAINLLQFSGNETLALEFKLDQYMDPRTGLFALLTQFIPSEDRFTTLLLFKEETRQTEFKHIEELKRTGEATCIEELKKHSFEIMTLPVCKRVTIIAMDSGQYGVMINCICTGYGVECPAEIDMRMPMQQVLDLLKSMLDAIQAPGYTIA
jgi:hypothetical protein